MNRQTQVSTWNGTTTGMPPKAQLMLRWQKQAKNKNLYVTFFGDDVTPPPPYVTFCH